MLYDQTPATLNPRMALDAAGQRLAALMFRALVRNDADLVPQPDLADSWKTTDSGRTWSFRIRDGQLDHQGRLIDAASLQVCLDQYRTGKPTSPLSSAFPYWKSTEVIDGQVVIKLDRPDPYLVRNLTALRYFTAVDKAKGTLLKPCQNPEAGMQLIGSGFYKPEKWVDSPDGELMLLPMQEGFSPVRFVFVRDETTRALKLLRGEGDAILNGLSFTKTRWIQKNYSKDFDVVERNGTTVSYLAFNLKDPILALKPVRKAIALSISREELIRHKFLGFTTLAGSFLSPKLPESHQADFRYDPIEAERLLDQAGFKRNKNGMRLTLHYKTTPVREGLETAQVFQAMLRKVGIELILDVVEPAVFLASTRKGKFQLFTSRWIGVADGSILYRTLHSGQFNNRAGYQDPEMDEALDRAMNEVELQKRKGLLKAVQEKMAEDLPYLPLWYWNNALIVRKDRGKASSENLSLTGALEPLVRFASGARKP